MQDRDRRTTRFSIKLSCGNGLSLPKRVRLLRRLNRSDRNFPVTYTSDFTALLRDVA